MQKMRAIQHDTQHPKTPLRVQLVETPSPKDKEILVRIRATALNRADLLQREGKYPPPKGASETLGLEMAGQIVSVGKDVQRWRVGEEVFGLLSGGGYAQYCVIHEDMALPKPPFWTFEEAAAIPEVFLTAFQSLFWTLGVATTPQQSSKRILIHAGASGVGSAAIQLAKIVGLDIFVTASKAKHSFCLDLGASLAIDYAQEDFERVILETTNGAGVDYLIDFVGKDYFKQNINVLALDGKMVLLAAMSGAKIDSFNLAKILTKRLQLTGSTLRSRSLEYQIALTQAFAKFALPLFETQQLKPCIDQIFEWQHAEEAHQYMRTNQNKGKIILKVE